jgi:hypothetical protein
VREITLQRSCGRIDKQEYHHAYFENMEKKGDQRIRHTTAYVHHFSLYYDHIESTQRRRKTPREEAGESKKKNKKKCSMIEKSLKKVCSSNLMTTEALPH